MSADLAHQAEVGAARVATPPRAKGLLRPTVEDKLRVKLQQLLTAMSKSAEDGANARKLRTLPGVSALSVMTRYIDGGRARFIEFVQLAMLNGNEPCSRWLLVFADLTPAERAQVSYDDVCEASGTRPAEIVGAITSAAVQFGMDVGNFVAAATHPQVVNAAVKYAKRSGGGRDREMLFQHSGFIPVPKNAIPSTVVNVNASATASAQAAAQAQSASGVPSFADDLRAVGQGRLPASFAASLPAPASVLALPEAEAPETVTFDGYAVGAQAPATPHPEPALVGAGSTHLGDDDGSDDYDTD